MRIVVDQDEVLAEFVQAVLNRWNQHKGTAYRAEDVNVWRMEEMLGEGSEKFIDDLMCERGFYENLEPVPGAIDGFNELRRSGHDVVVATSIPKEAIGAFDGKRFWMQKYFPDFSMKNFFACSRKGWIGGDILIDDGTHNIDDWSKNERPVAIVLDRPWNREITVWSETIILRASGWRDVNTIVRTLAELHAAV